MIQELPNTRGRKVKNRTINNTNSDKLVITRDKLYYKLTEYQKGVGKRSHIYTSIGLVISLLIPLITCDFKIVLGINGNIIKGFVFCLFVLSIVYFGYALFMLWKYKEISVNDLIDKICDVED